jgi:hypothetical protein
MLVMDKRARGRDARDQRGNCRVLSDLESSRYMYRGRSHKLEAWESVDGRFSRVRKAHSTFQPRSNATSTPTPSTNQPLIETLMSLSVRLWYTATQASPSTPPSPRIFERTARVHHTPRHDSESQRQSIAPTSLSPPCTSSLVLNDT